MVLAVLFTIVKIRKQPKCPPTDTWIEKMWYIFTVYTMEYFSAIKKNRVVPFATTRMDLEGIVLDEMRQEDKYHMIPLVCGI